MTHSELVERAGRWLKNTMHCRVVLCELVANTAWMEIPDAIGWVSGKTILVECKVSRSDFFADQKKHFRLQHGFMTKALGDWRFYLTPSGLIKPDEVPANWGLYEVHGRTVRYAGGIKYANAAKAPFESNKRSEIAMLVSALSRRS